MNELSLATAINLVPGGVVTVASKCKVSPRAVYKWLSAGRLPRTDYSGETAYAKAIAKESNGAFTEQQLLEATKQNAA